MWHVPDVGRNFLARILPRVWCATTYVAEINVLKFIPRKSVRLVAKFSLGRFSQYTVGVFATLNFKFLVPEI